MQEIRAELRNFMRMPLIVPLCLSPRHLADCCSSVSAPPSPAHLPCLCPLSAPRMPLCAAPKIPGKARPFFHHCCSGKTVLSLLVRTTWITAKVFAPAGARLRGCALAMASARLRGRMRFFLM
ncbi:unnamed protein product [Prorocentrum cordatum]|uniref:Uncharacterized protein n=1 Tax=Prorocentrum cordatum TaxID=2364126 RepID=A0ABN9S4V0_9DINO|nr:unnamed protein product [Polarella glacialis]